MSYWTRDNNFSEKELKGIDLLLKSIKKKYPFIKGWAFSDDYENYVVSLYLDLYIDTDKLLQFYNLTIKPSYIDEIRKKYKTSYLFTPFESIEKDEGFKIIEQIEMNMREFYELLPKDFQIILPPKNDLVGQETNVIPKSYSFIFE